MIARAFVFALSGVVLLTVSAQGAEVEVKMLNQGPDGIMVFEPGLTKIKPDDTVKFVAADQGHSAESIDGMVPDGANRSEAISARTCRSPSTRKACTGCAAPRTTSWA